MQHIATALAGEAAATLLTSLQLGSTCGILPLQQQYAVPMCGSLAGLACLRYLRIEVVCLVPGDALALTTLTGLKRLDLYNLHDGVGRWKLWHLHAASSGW
jgi:hypothetical protein